MLELSRGLGERPVLHILRHLEELLYKTTGVSGPDNLQPVGDIPADAIYTVKTMRRIYPCNC